MKSSSRLFRALAALVVSLLLVVTAMPPAMAAASVNAITKTGNPPLYNVLHAAPYNLDPANTGNITDAEMADLTGELDLRSKGLSNLEGLQYAMNIATLVLVGNNDLADITPIVGMHNLKNLYISYTVVEDLPADLSGLDSLVFLSCGWTPIRETDANKNAILSLPNVKTYDKDMQFSLVLDSFTDMSFLSPAAAPGLKSLSWGYMPGRGNSQFESLAALTQLNDLSFDYDNSVGAPGSTALATVAEHLTGLTSLGIQQCGVKNLSAIAGMTNLTHLTLSYNEIQDIRPLSGMSNLEWLFIDNNYISDLTPLSGKTKLKTLAADRNYLDPTPGSKDRAILDELSAHPGSFVGYGNQRRTVVHFDASPYDNPANIPTYYGADITLPDVTGLPSGKMLVGWDIDGNGTADRGAGGKVAFTWPALPVPNSQATYKACVSSVDPNSLLSGIALSPTSRKLSPAFTGKRLEYTVSLPASAASVTIKPIKPALAAITIDSAAVTSKMVFVGCGQSKTVAIAVKSNKGNLITYHVTVTRAQADDVRLLSLGQTTGSLSPAFDPYITGYTLTLPQGIGSVTLKPVKAAAYSKLYINGKLASSKTFTLAPGKNVKATVKVTLPNGTACAYTIIIKRLPGAKSR